MSKRTKDVLRAAKKDKEFLALIYEVDQIKAPSFWSSQLDNDLFAVLYMGYMVAKHGKNWEVEAYKFNL
jgi:hypothetical protein